MELRIGIVLNYKNAEKKKDELYPVNSRYWLESAENHPELTIMRKKKECVPADIAIGLYLESLPKDPNFKIKIDYISPDDISIQRFRQNDIVFIIIYDLLESFHLSDKSKFEKFKNKRANE